MTIVKDPCENLKDKTYKELSEMQMDILENRLRDLEDIRQEQRKVRDDVEFIGGEIKQIIKRANETNNVSTKAKTQTKSR